MIFVRVLFRVCCVFVRSLFDVCSMSVRYYWEADAFSIFQRFFPYRRDGSSIPHMLFRMLQIAAYLSGNKEATRFHFVSALLPLMGDSGNKVETKRQHVSTFREKVIERHHP